MTRMIFILIASMVVACSDSSAAKKGDSAESSPLELPIPTPIIEGEGNDLITAVRVYVAGGYGIAEFANTRIAIEGLVTEDKEVKGTIMLATGRDYRMTGSGPNSALKFSHSFDGTQTTMSFGGFEFVAQKDQLVFEGNIFPLNDGAGRCLVINAQKEIEQILDVAHQPDESLIPAHLKKKP